MRSYAMARAGNIPYIYNKYLGDTLSFKPVIERAQRRGEEVFFGLDNSLRVGLINTLTILKENIQSEQKANPNIKMIAILDKHKPSIDAIADVIRTSFNVEKVSIGFTGDYQAMSLPSMYDKNLVGASEDAKSLRKTMDDIVEYKDGFRYRNKKGIYYAVILGTHFLVTDYFTVPETAAILIHELGHSMQHLVMTINALTAVDLWHHVMRAIHEHGWNGPARMVKLAKIVKLALLDKNFRRIKDVGDAVLNEANEKDYVDFTKLTPTELTAMTNDTTPLDGPIHTPTRRRNLFVRSLLGVLKGLLGVLFTVYWGPVSLYRRSQAKKDYNQYHKYDEQMADSFAAYYGLADELGTSMVKIGKLYKSYQADQGIINYVPLLNLWKIYTEAGQLYSSMMCGYPVTKQRIVNCYVALDYEIKNNKDLSEDAKAAIKQQMEDLSETYETFVKENAPGGLLYFISSKIAGDTIEKAAAKDPSLKNTILDPLRKKQEAGGFKL
jgi:hypothetical protein